MPEELVQVPTRQSRLSHVQQTLCRKENLLAEQFELQVVPLLQQGADCGLQFLLRGPRSVRLGAVWAAEPNLLYFWMSTGAPISHRSMATKSDSSSRSRSAPRIQKNPRRSFINGGMSSEFENKIRK